MPEYNIGDTIDSRYLLKKSLGGGRVGKVYLAYDSKSNTDIAIKLLSDRPHSDREINLFTREFNAIKNLNHPGVVKVFELGSDYFTMEYVDGDSLTKLKGGDVAQIFEVGIDIARVLEYIHRQGVIHRDLKPENIKLSSLGQVKILDFGFAIDQDVANLLAADNPEIAGTLNYMAPEVIKGFQIDPRADLYSLGIIFYELTTGQLPFKSADIFTTVVRQVETNAVPPTTHNPKITPGFEEIILKLIAKSPVRRFQSADELLEYMMRLAGRSEILRIKIDRGRKFLYPPKFAGREAELKQMQQVFDKAMLGRSKLLLLRGEDGIGKTSTLRQFKANLAMPKILFLDVECDNASTNNWSGMAQIIHEIFKFLEKTNSALLLSARRWAPILLAIAPNLSSKSYLVGATAEQNLSEESLLQNLCLFFIEISRTHPLALMFDNLEWLDHSSVALLHRLIQTSQDHPIFICGTYRGPSQQGDFEKLIPRLLAKKQCEEIVLSGLSASELGVMLGAMIGQEQLTGSLVDKIHEISRGIPLLAEETMKNMSDDGLIFRQGGIWHIEVDDLRKIRRPNILEDTLLKKYEDINQGSKRIIQIASAIGHRFPRLLLEKICKMPDSDLDALLRGLLEQGFLAQIADNLQIEFIIGSPRLAQLIYQRMLPKNKEQLHEEIAKQLEGLAGAENRAEELAHHYFQANLKRKSVPYWITAGDHHERQYAYISAIQSYEKALAITQQKGMLKELLEILEKLGNVCCTMGQYDKALQHYQQGLILAHSPKQKTPFYKGMGIAFFKKGEFEKSKEHFETLLKILRQEKQNIGTELTWMASLHIALGQYDDAQTLLKQAIKIARADKNRLLQAVVYDSSAQIHYMLGHWPHAMDYYQHALQILAKVENQRLQSQICKGMAQIYMQQGKFSPAYRHLEQALYLCHLTGDLELKVMISLDIGFLLECSGHLESAHSRYLEALDTAQDLSLKSGEAHAEMYLGRYFLLQERPMDALEHLQQSQEIFQQLQLTWAIAECYLLQGQAYHIQGDYENALRCLDMSEQTISVLHSNWRLIAVYTEIGEIYRKTNRSDQANKMFNKALKIARDVMNNEALLGRIHVRYGLFCCDSNLSRETIEHFVTATVFWQRTGCSLELAKTYYEYGHALLELERKGDQGFMKVALHQLHKAKEIYQKANFGTMLNKTLLLIKECERQQSDALGRRDLAVKLRTFGRSLTEAERTATKQWDDFRNQFLNEIGEDMDRDALLAELDKRIAESSKHFQEQIENMRVQNNTLITEVENLKSERDSLLTLQKISNTINSVLESQKLLNMIMDMVIKELRAERGFLVTNQEKDFVVRCARNISSEEISQEDFNFSQSILRRVITTGEAVLTSDAQADARFNSQSIMDLRLRSILCVPLKIRERILGAIYLDNRFVSGLFTEHDLEFLSAFSNQAAIALENAFLYEELREKERMEQELSIAARIQSGLLPKDLPNVQGIEVYGKMVPARQVGGDYYDFIVAPDNNSVSIVIGDVSGKGIPAGLVMVMARLILHHFLRNPDISTRETLIETNNLLKDNTEPFIFMSMLLARWEGPKQRFVYTGAGHENLIICRKQSKDLEVIPAGGVVLGVKDHIEEFLEEKEIALNSGDSVIFYTDGVTECMSASGEMLELDGFLAMVRNHLGKAPSETVAALLEELTKYMGTAEQHDDITLMVVKKN